ncbi:hypothetical protein Tco_0296519 [Tanacetum coccineum]
MSQHNTIYKRTNEPQRTPQFDDIVQRMKTEGTVIYGTRLPEELLNEVVKSSMACKTYEKEMRKLGGEGRALSNFGSINKFSVKKKTMTINELIPDEEEAAIRLARMLSADKQRQKNEREKQKAKSKKQLL